MKIKVDFVTNSSSASFMILKKHLSDKQISFIYEHIEIGAIVADKEGTRIYAKRGDGWGITETDKTIEGWTSMDNFDMLWYLDKIGVQRRHIQYEHSG